MTPEEITAFLEEHFPQSTQYGFKIRHADGKTAEVVLDAGYEHLRPGGTISGPTMMAMVDMVMYVLVLSAVGPRSMAVTTSLNINFLRRPDPGSIIAIATMLKLGRRLAVGEVGLYHLKEDGDPDRQAGPIAHATCTYALPSD